MIAAAIVQTVVLLTSGAFNVLLNPGTLAVSNQLFVSSVILMIGFAQGLILVTFKVIVRLITGWNLHCSSSYLFAPLASAMSNSVNDRPGETDVNTPIVTPIQPRSVQSTHGRPSAYDGYDTEDDDADVTATHFMPELEMAIDERRNVYTDIYLLGIATFTTTYCIDTVSPVPTTAFVSGLLIMSIAQSTNIMVILARSNVTYLDVETTRAMRGKRLLTVTSCIFATGAFVVFCIGLADAKMATESIQTMFDVTFSIILPLIAPWLLVTVSPKQQPLRTLFECTPFVFTICFSFVLFFLATRGQMSAMIHEFSSAVANENNSNTTKAVISGNVVELQFHSDVNASIHFNMDVFSTTSVDSAGNIPMLMFAPLVKIPTIVVVLANVINRSNLVVITALMVTMSLREIAQTDVNSSAHRAYCGALVLSIMSLVFNVFKYMKLPNWVLSVHGDRDRHRNESIDQHATPLEEL
jgi:hypothetical protein